MKSKIKKAKLQNAFFDQMQAQCDNAVRCADEAIPQG